MMSTNHAGLTASHRNAAEHVNSPSQNRPVPHVSGLFCRLAIEFWRATQAGVDHYKVLRVGRRASFQELELAYKREMEAAFKSRWSGWATVRRSQVQAAFDALADPNLRRAYDLRLAMFGGHYPQPPV